MSKQHVWIALALVASAMIGLSAGVLPWWSSGDTSMIGMSLDLTGIKACLGSMCERKWYSELPKQAFAKDPTQFVALGRITLGLGAAGGVALLAHIAMLRSTSTKIAPARLALYFFVLALATASAFFVLRPEVSMMDPQMGDMEQPHETGELGELGDAMTAMIVPELGAGPGFPLFAIGAAAGVVGSVIALRRRE